MRGSYQKAIKAMFDDYDRNPKEYVAFGNWGMTQYFRSRFGIVMGYFHARKYAEDFGAVFGKHY